ncbi:hypothetical protein [Pediococcus ethanolidurans]|uniref:Uncharacterized protein n=1 Tax=Pediococcus ethanolidurans TaxID=319653 RepID=A0A0R2K182_9LACO|nr:hypothetical protein [Pediococcus ethanolidurans]KRN81510.1 hypothetical protein IV87_GL001148 [Pediococcus ethanolidurans]GEN95874.1 hypothetical protein PET01_19240 [Pediococcus ethanolidurans]SER86719.1 hypothetical protein SAMN04487973_12215 [Pediococcus ethanolidurans]
MKHLYETNTNKNIFLRSLLKSIVVTLVYVILSLIVHNFDFLNTVFILVDFLVLAYVADWAKTRLQNKFFQLLLLLLAGVVLMITIVVIAMIFHM